MEKIYSKTLDKIGSTLKIVEPPKAKHFQYDKHWNIKKYTGPKKRASIKWLAQCPHCGNLNETALTECQFCESSLKNAKFIESKF